MGRCPTCHRRLGAGALCPTDGDQAPAESPGVYGAPPEIAGWDIGEPLGRGGSSTVWSAIRHSDGTPAALKVARSRSASLARRFRREASVLSRLEPGHAPALFATGRLADDIPFLAMERLGGVTLAEHLEQRSSPDDVHTALAIARSILGNLRVVHDSGLRHYDLKPGNIFLVAEPPDVETRLVDFGLTSLPDVDDDESGIEVVAGTVEYMAPERIGRKQGADARADIYGFGVVLFELLTLRVPFVGDRALIERGHVAMRPPRPSSLASVSSELDDLVRACLDKVPAKRPSVDEIAVALESGVGSSRTRAELSSSSGPVKRTRSSREPVVVLVADIVNTEEIAEVRRRGGIIARQRGTVHAVVFVGALCEEPAAAALAAAEALSDRGVRVALHLAELRVRELADENSVRVYGAAVQEPETWLPATPFSGVVLTDEFATAVDLALQPVPSLQGFRTIVSDDDLEPTPSSPFIGRRAITEAAEASLRGCFSSRSPALFTVIGGSGLGKSRLARELAHAAETQSGARVIHVRARAGVDNKRRLLALIGAAELADMPERDAARDVGEMLVAASKLRPTAVVIDDAHRLGDRLCDAIEYATLDTRDAPLWIAVTANPRFVNRRRRWGQRANRHQQEVLVPLAEESAMELAAELLKPAEYPPAAILRRISEWASGNPFFIVEIVRALKRQGVIRERQATRSHYVAAADFDKLPAIPAGQWLATRLLETMPSELASLLRLCAILGNEFTRDELSFVQDAADALASSSSVDTDVGLVELERLGALRGHRRGWAFVHEAVADAIARALPDDELNALRGVARDFWRDAAASGDESAMLRFARHAAASGEKAPAISTYLALGDRAREAHRPVDAEQLYSAALELEPGDRGDRARALGGRGEARYRMQRLADAISDLDEAAAIAGELGDKKRRALWLLARATALDWADRYAESAAHVDEATVLATELGDAQLRARCTVALGRTRWREERIEDAIALLSRGADEVAATEDYEYRVIALLLLPLALVFADRRNEAAVRFEEVIALCEDAGDRFHLCAAYTNRMFLYRNDPALAVGDLRRANQLAREVGQASAERAATHNLAEILFWSGDDSESLALAERGFELQVRLFPRPVADDALLLARIRAGRREWEAVSARLDWIQEAVAPDSLAPSDRLMLGMLRLLVEAAEARQDASAAWETLVADARETLAAEEFLELLYMRARAALEFGSSASFTAAVAEAAERLPTCAVWQARYAALEIEQQRVARD